MNRDDKGRFIKGCVPLQNGKSFEEFYGKERAKKIRDKISKSHMGKKQSKEAIRKRAKACERPLSKEQLIIIEKAKEEFSSFTPKENIKEWHIWDLNYNLVRVRLNKEYASKFYAKCLKFFRTKRNIGKIFGYTDSVSDFWIRRNDMILLKNLFILSRAIGVPFSEIEENISEMSGGLRASGKCIKKPRLPFRHSTHLAKILGHLSADGCLKEKGNNDKYRIHYVNMNYELIEDFMNSVKGFFGDIHININRNGKDKQAYELTLPKIAGIIIKSICDISFYGYYTEVPDLIFNSSQEVKYVYLRAIFDDDGTLSIPAKQVSMTTISKKFAYGIKELLKSLGILSSIFIRKSRNENEKMSYMVYLSGRGVQKFYERINFISSKKRRKLSELMNSYKIPYRNVMKIKEFKIGN